MNPLKLGTKKSLKDWLLVLASLVDDAAVVVLVLLALRLFQVPVTVPVIIILAVFITAFAFIVHKLVVPALHRKKAVGAEAMIGLEIKLSSPLTPEGVIKVKGEYWRAESGSGDIPAGETIEIAAIKGLTLVVKRKKQTSKP